MVNLTPIPLTRIGQPEPSKPKPTASTGLKPITITSSPVVETESSEHMREEFDRLQLALRLHDNKSEPLDDLIYKKTLQRALDIVTQLNQTTAGPKAKNSKTPAAKQSPKSLSDL